MNTDDLLKKLGELIKAEGEAIRKDMATKTDIERLEKRMDKSDETQSRIVTALEAVAAGQADVTTKVAAIETKQKVQATKQDVETTVDAAKAELKGDIYTLEGKLIKKIQRHERRISNIEESEDIENPDKN